MGDHHLKKEENTFMISFTSKFDIEGIKNIIETGNTMLYDVNIISFHLKDNNGLLYFNGIKKIEANYATMPRNVVTINCISNIDKTQKFKIRWIVSNLKHKIYIVSKLKPSITENILNRFIGHIGKKIKFYDVQPTSMISINGSYMTSNVDFLYLSDKIDKTCDLTYIYTPGKVKSLNIFSQNGTVSINETGKISYLGSPDEASLIKLHEKIGKIIF